MKREDLEKLGLEKDVIDQIIDIHGKGTNALKSELESKKAELTTANTTINDLNDKVKAFDGVDVEAMKTEIKDLKDKYDIDMAEKDQTYAMEQLFKDIPFASELAKKAAMVDFKEKKLSFADGEFLGAKEYFEKLKEIDPAAFKVDEADPKKITLDKENDKVKETDEVYEVPAFF